MYTFMCFHCQKKKIIEKLTNRECGKLCSRAGFFLIKSSKLSPKTNYKFSRLNCATYFRTLLH